MPGRQAAAYQWTGTVMLRASTTSPGELELPGTPVPEGECPAAAWTGWLRRVWAREDVRAALAVASPALFTQAEEATAAGPVEGRDAGRIALAVASYLLRWQYRATPFGLFAGVALARVGGRARVRWHGHRPVARPDAAWLGDVVAALEQNLDLLSRLDIVASDAVSWRGGRLTAPGPVPDGPGHGLAPVEVSARATAAATAVLQGASEPVTAGKLAAEVAALFPDAARERVDRLLDQTVRTGMLITSLRAPMTCPDPLGHVCDRLAAAGAGNVPQVASTVKRLAALRDDLRASDCRAASVTTLTARMRKLSKAVVMPLAVDTVLDCDVRVPDQVAREAADAAVVLCRVSPFPSGDPAWLDYHARFLDRYGSDAVVAVQDLVADSGLGFPDGFLGAASGRPARPVTSRDAVLAALVQQATADGFTEIALTRELVGELASGVPAEEIRLPPRVEIAVEVRAASIDELDRGRFTLAVHGVPPPATSMLGRHAWLLPEADRALLADTFTTSEPGVTAAHLSFTPRVRRDENVTRTVAMLETEIPIGEHRPGGPALVRLTDLAVTADEERMRLIRLSTGELVDVRIPHALEARTYTPPLARFLSEVASAPCAAYMPFDFGAACSGLPWLPRVRYRRTILSPARWNLRDDNLPGLSASQAEWTQALGAWRRRWHVPEAVAITDYDRHLPLSLGHPAHLQVLRDRLRRASQLELRETARGQDLGWIGRAHQLVLPLRSADHTRSVPPATAAGGRSQEGKTIVRALLASHPARFNELTTAHLPHLESSVNDHASSWWFRFHGRLGGQGPGRRLAVYIVPADPGAYRDVAGDLAEWSNSLVRQRLASSLTIDTVPLRAGPFGDGQALGLVPEVFAADSAAVISQTSMSLRANVDQVAVTAASMADLAACIAPSATEGMQWLATCLNHEHVRLDPAVRTLAFCLAPPGGGDLADHPGSAEVAAAWEVRANALARYRKGLAGPYGTRDVLRTLLREHLARVAFADHAAERSARQLARACALRWLATAREPWP